MGKIPQNVCCSKSIVINLLSDRPVQKVPKSNELFEACGLAVLLLSHRMRKVEIVNFVYVPHAIIYHQHWYHLKNLKKKKSKLIAHHNLQDELLVLSKLIPG